MDHQYAENLALQKVEQAKGHLYRYSGDGEADLKGETGTFGVLEDMNCCAPTDQVLFVFFYGDNPDCPKRRVLSAEAFLDFLDQAQRADI